MKNTFGEIKLFQVKPSKINDFEVLISKIVKEQKNQAGCIDAKYIKRFYVMDEVGVEPRELTKIVKCVKYYSCWEFDSIENYTVATKWFFESYEKELSKLLIMPFDINCGYTII